MGAYFLANQYSVKVYEVEIVDERKFMTFFNANHTLFKNHLILIQGQCSRTIQKYLDSKSLMYLVNIRLPKSNTNSNSLRKSLEADLEIEKQKAIDIQKEAEEKLKALRQKTKEIEAKSREQVNHLSNRLENNLKVMDSMIRSGQEINIEGDLLLLNRLNSGATINTSGNLIVTKVVEGSIRCNGNFMMLTASPKANIVFHGVRVDNTLLEDKLNRVELKENKIKITPVLKKEINWA